MLGAYLIDLLLSSWFFFVATLCLKFPFRRFSHSYSLFPFQFRSFSSITRSFNSWRSVSHSSISQNPLVEDLICFCVSNALTCEWVHLSSLYLSLLIKLPKTKRLQQEALVQMKAIIGQVGPWRHVNAFRTLLFCCYCWLRVRLRVLLMWCVVEQHEGGVNPTESMTRALISDDSIARQSALGPVQLGYVFHHSSTCS